MKLTELVGQFVGQAAVNPKSFVEMGAKSNGAQGVLFQCPKCAEGKERSEDGGFVGAHSVLIWFANPINAPVAPPEWKPKPRWQRTGETIDTLTLSPSVDNTHNEDGTPSGCPWHGWVKNGDAQ